MALKHIFGETRKEKTFKYVYVCWNMTNKRVTLSVDAKIYEEYKKYCEEKGIILSKQFELFMKEEIRKFKEMTK